MQDFEDKEFIDEILDVDCPSCGSKLFYSAEFQKITCHHCGYKEDFKRSNDKIVEHPLDTALGRLQQYVPEESDKKVYDCVSCGAKFMVDADRTRVICAFCGSENVNLEAFDHKYIQPAGILPFLISRQKSEQEFATWLKRGWFHPNSLKRLARIDGLHGIYIPSWTYDAHTASDWRGEAGYYYYETVRVKVGNNWQTKQVRKTRWVWKNGKLNHFFDDVLVSASANLHQNFMNRILPYRLEEAVNFDARLMVGWESEVYSLELDKGWEVADKLIDEQIRMMCMQALGGDTQRNLSVQTSKSKQTFKHLILPVWIASYTFNNKIYRFAVNGQTGKVHGEKPIAWWKILLLIILFILFILLIVWLGEQGQPAE